jgi:magnesium transporter
MQENEISALESTASKEALLKEFEELLPASCADLLKDREITFIRDVLVEIPPDRAAEIFSHFEQELQLKLSESFTSRQLTNIVTQMSHDERVDFFQALPEERQESLFRRMAQSEREDIIRLGAYEDGTAGAVMTSEYMTLSLNITAGEALAKLRKEGPEKETIYESYIVDSDRKLIGVISLKDLILAPTHSKLSDIMQTDIIFVRSSDDQEEAAQKIAKYDLLAIPVLNDSDALVGIITHDDVLDILQEEHTEDVEKLMAITASSGGNYLEISSWDHFKRRVSWIVGLAAMGVFSGAIIHRFESVLEQYILLAIYMPMMADTGGNTGSQSATVVIRALALQQVQLKDSLKVLFKEFKVSLLLAIILMLLAFIKVLFISDEPTLPSGRTLKDIAFIVSGALGLQVITSTLIGALLPLGAAKLKVDPAIIAAPALTTVVDISGLLIYFLLAQALLL